jgi:hypothetical protein
VTSSRRRYERSGIAGLDDRLGRAGIDHAKIGNFMGGWNDRCHPFLWTKIADDMLTANRSIASRMDR